MRFVFYGNHHQAIGFNAIAPLVALLALAAGIGAAFSCIRRPGAQQRGPGARRLAAARRSSRASTSSG